MCRLRSDQSDLWSAGAFKVRPEFILRLNLTIIIIQVSDTHANKMTGDRVQRTGIRLWMTLALNVASQIWP